MRPKEAEAAFGGSQVLAVTCGAAHTLAGTKACDLSSFTWEQHFALGHNDNNNRLVQTHIKAAFGNGNIVSAAAGPRHSVVVTEKGILYTWGQAQGLGHANKQAKQIPMSFTPHLLQGVRAGCCHSSLPPLYARTFAMGMYAWLGNAALTAAAAGGRNQRRLQRQEGKALDAAEKGKDYVYVTMPEELV